MATNTPVRKPHTSTADLLTWPEYSAVDSSATASAARSHQPSDEISKVVFGGQVTDEEVGSLNKRNPYVTIDDDQCSRHNLNGYYAIWNQHGLKSFTIYTKLQVNLRPIVRKKQIIVSWFLRGTEETG